MNTASAISRNNQSPEAPRTRFASENPKRSGSDASLELRPLVALSPSTLHIVAIPLIILSTLAVGFMLVYLKEILVPFVVAMFFVYLLRPLVELLTRPCASCCHESCIDSGYRVDGHTVKSLKRSATSRGKSSDSSLSRRSASGSHAKSPRPDEASGKITDIEEPFVRFCRVCTITRCPRWIAVLIALSVVGMVLSMLVLLVADAIQSLEGEDIKMYHDSANAIADKTLTWINLLFHVDGSSLLKSLKTQVPVADLVQKLLFIMIDAIGNTFLILLIVLYLLFEQSSHAPGSLKRKIDDQIQRYIGIKTLISAGVGFLVYLVLGPMLKVNLAHIFGVLTFFLNYIPNVGPVIATAIPLPLIVLDLRLTTTAKLLAIALPTAIHLVIGNFVEPKVFGHSLELHPVIVLLSLAFWFALWGVVGAILSIPVTAVLRIALSHINHPYARVMIRLLEGHIGLADVEFVQSIGIAEVPSDLDGAVSDDGDEETGLGLTGATRVRESAPEKGTVFTSTSPFSDSDDAESQRLLLRDAVAVKSR